MADPEIVDTILHAAGELEKLNVAYIHLSEADWDDAPTIPEDFPHKLRAAYSGRIVVAGRYDKDRAGKILADGLADLVAFGRPCVTNPDLPKRLQHNLALADLDGATLFGGDGSDDTDYAPLAGCD